MRAGNVGWRWETRSPVEQTTSCSRPTRPAPPASRSRTRGRTATRRPLASATPRPRPSRCCRARRRSTTHGVGWDVRHWHVYRPTWIRPAGRRRVRRRGLRGVRDVRTWWDQGNFDPFVQHTPDSTPFEVTIHASNFLPYATGVTAQLSDSPGVSLVDLRADRTRGIRGANLDDPFGRRYRLGGGHRHPRPDCAGRPRGRHRDDPARHPRRRPVGQPGHSRGLRPDRPLRRRRRRGVGRVPDISDRVRAPLRRAGRGQPGDTIHVGSRTYSSIRYWARSTSRTTRHWTATARRRSRALSQRTRGRSMRRLAPARWTLRW